MRKFESRRRRIVMSAAAAPLAAASMSPWLARAQGAPAGDKPMGERIALVLGNSDYPDGKSLPAAAKNVTDVERALKELGFQVETKLDVNPAAFRSALESFGRSVAAKPGAVVLFYYCGHGVESDGDNLLLPAGISERLPPSQLKRDGVNLQKEVLTQFPHVYPGLSITVVDACRTSLDAVPNPLKNLTTDAPDGNIIMYATRAGKPALMPADPTRNSFFTEIFVKSLQRLEVDGDPYRTTPLYPLLQHVRSEVFNAMSKHPVRLVRENAQDPHILHNIAVDDFYLAPRKPTRPPAQVTDEKPPIAPSAESEEKVWRNVQSAVLPRDVQDRAKAYLQAFPNGPNAVTAQVTVDQTERALRALAEPGMPLRASGLSDVRGSPRARTEAASAARGDKDAAQRLGDWFSRGAEGLENNQRRSEAWLRYASALGSGLASKRLVRLYQDQGRVNEAAIYRSRAIEQGEYLEPELSAERK